jgi:hypothetical protein
LAEYDFCSGRLADRIGGTAVDSGNGTPVPVTPMTDEEYLWEPVPGCWSIRRRAGGPGSRATLLVGAGDWARDSATPHPEPPPFTTIAWRLAHLTEMLTLRADYTVGSRSQTIEGFHHAATAADAIADFRAALAAWREALTTCPDADLDTIGRSAYPYGSDPEDPFIDTIWWVNQEITHHAAEIALLRDLFRERA